MSYFKAGRPTDRRSVSGRGSAGRNSGGRRATLPCPLCGSRLIRGERIRSVAFDLGKEKLMHIHGCPFCEAPGTTVKRRCPVCRRELPAAGFVVGRMWDKPGKTHLHITGCTECKPQYRDAPAGRRAPADR